MISFVFRLSWWAAIVGGVILCLITLMVVASITGRTLVPIGLAPIPGDFELVEMGTAVLVFCFLPWTYLRGGHATVDLLYVYLPPMVQRLVQVVCDLAMLGLWLVLTWRLALGMLERREFYETTFILQMPLWWGYALCLVAAVIGCLAYFSQTLIRLGLANYPAGWSQAEAKEH